MAKINFGGVVQDARGKQNGLVYSKNGSGSYVKRKVTPVNPNTLKQQTVRANFSDLAKAWSGTLTDTERAAWIAYATLFPRRDVFGNSLTLNGLNMFISVNQALLQAGQPMLTTPAAAPTVSPIPVGALNAISPSAEVQFVQNNADDGTGDLYYIFGAPPLAPGRSVSQSLYRFLLSDAQAALAGAVIGITAAYTATFGNMATGQAINILVSAINPDTGAVAVGYPLRAIAA